MNASDRLHQAIDQEQRRLRAGIPPDRQAAILALLRVRDRLPTTPGIEQPPDLITGRHLPDLGGNKALALCLEAPDDASAAPAAFGGEPVPAASGKGVPAPSSTEALDAWAERFLAACGQLAEAELVLAYAETGYMRLIDDGGSFAAWVATKRAPANWLERADIDRWAARLAARHAPELRALRSERPALASAQPDAAAGASPAAAAAAWYRRLAGVYLETMAYQLGYPPDAAIGGCTVQLYREVLARLIAWALQERDHGDHPTPQSEAALVADLASALAADPAAVGRALAGFALDRAGAAYHAAVPGVAPAPLVRLAPSGPGEPDRVVWSPRGLTTEPLFFLARELRRRDATAYHNTAFLREDVFRHDLYALFADKRFVTGGGRVALRRDGGDVRTDVDAVVFDRKTGSLGLFELKSQDPFARTPAELARQRDNLRYANRQLSGVLDWVKRHGADALLQRVDAQTAKTFRAHKVYPFVLGRYLADIGDGPPPDRRAAWGTWPQLLRLLDGQPVPAGGANPLASLFARLSNDAPIVVPPTDAPPREVALGAARLVVCPSYAAYRAGPDAVRGG